MQRAIRKDPDAGKDWRQEKGVTEHKMVGWHHQLNEHEFEQALGTSDGQGSLGCFSLWGHKELDMTEQLNWTELNWGLSKFDVFEPWRSKRLLGIPWTARRSIQSILKETDHEYSLEGVMLRLKLQHFGHLMWRANSSEKMLMLGKIEGRRRRG